MEKYGLPDCPLYRAFLTIGYGQDFPDGISTDRLPTISGFSHVVAYGLAFTTFGISDCPLYRAFLTIMITDDLPKLVDNRLPTISGFSHGQIRNPCAFCSTTKQIAHYIGLFSQKF